MTRFTLLLFFILPVVSFAQISEQAQKHSTKKTDIFSGLPADVYSQEYENKKAELSKLSHRQLIELGIGAYQNPSTSISFSNGGDRAVCNDPYIPVDTLTYTPVPRNDDGSLYIDDIGFTFSFCGSNYSSLYINTNGNLSFDNPVGQFSPNGFPYPEKMVAPFWADVDTRNTACGQAWYQLFGNYMIVSLGRSRLVQF